MGVAGRCSALGGRWGRGEGGERTSGGEFALGRGRGRAATGGSGIAAHPGGARLAGQAASDGGAGAGIVAAGAAAPGVARGGGRRGGTRGGHAATAWTGRGVVAGHCTGGAPGSDRGVRAVDRGAG